MSPPQPGAPVTRWLDGGQGSALAAGVAVHGRMPTSPKGVQGMSKWKAVFRCEQLGVDNCVVWWDAVAAVGAAAGVFVTALSAFAVYWLGRQAHSLAKTAHDAQKEYERRRAQEILAEQVREEVVTLAYCCAELDELDVRLAGINGLFAVNAKSFVEYKDDRAYLAKTCEKLVTARLEKMLPRMHVLPEKTGIELARLLAHCSRLISLTAEHAVEKSPADFPDPVKEQEQREYLSTCHSNRMNAAKDARDLAKSLAVRARAVVRRYEPVNQEGIR